MTPGSATLRVGCATVCASSAEPARQAAAAPKRMLSKCRVMTASSEFQRIIMGHLMNADLERVIALQRLDSAAHDAQRRLADEPERAKALDGRLEAARQRLASARERLAENQNA